jgi:N-methylhydantoinase B
MTAVTPRPVRSITDPIALELLRSRLEAVAQDAAVTIERTGVSPTATETHDLSATLLDADGNLVAGGGWVSYHFVAATHAVKSTIERYGDEIQAGDVFLANDPYNGGGLHPNDVFVERPIFVDGKRVAWVALSAHLADMGGMAVGSFAPAATECYQEAFRVPPVRLFRAGEEISDVWDLLRTNVRMSQVVEMDLRALVAGGHVAQEKVAELASDVGTAFFLDGLTALQDLSERELRRRIDAMPDGAYRSDAWTDWDDELYHVPCTLTIDGDRMVFDFEGASPQAPHFFNSQPYIIKSAMVMQLARSLAADLPYTEGLLAPIEMRCPEATIVNARPPAPMQAGHMHVGALAAEMMLQCVRLALWASSPQLPASRFVHGWSAAPLMSLAIWSGNDFDGHTTIWGMVDGTWSGTSGTPTRDGVDQAVVPVGMAQSPSATDVEVLESWYPLLLLERKVRSGVNGAGEHRSGGGTQLKLQPYGGGQLSGQMLGTREWLPLDGAAGGFPGSTTIYEVTRHDGTVERISTKAAGVVLEPGDTFEVRCGSSGGLGDPLDREPSAVAHDVSVERITRADASTVYGVVLDHDGRIDDTATDARRAALRTERLGRASAPVSAVSDDVVGLADGEPLPLYPGIVQRGAVAFAERSGAPLAVAPDHWTDGCAVLEEPVPERGPGREIIVRSYLDPTTGRSLYVESVPAGEPRAFEVSPKRWTAARSS